MKPKKMFGLPLIVLLLCVTLLGVFIPILTVKAQVTTLATTELLNFYSMTTGEKNTFVDLLVTQGITRFILRGMAMYEWDDTSYSTIDSRVTHAKEFVTIANAHSIDVCYDLHTWYTTWDSYFDDSASGYAANRAKYITYVSYVLNAFDDSNVYAFMVLNEPQAQTATSGENQFILDVITAANGATDKPISVRFMCGYSASTGHYSSAIDTACDFLCRNTYWDARHPTVTVYGTTEAKILTAINAAHTNSKEFWMTEFGKPKTDLEEQRSFVAGFVAYAKEKDMDAVYCWASQPEGGSGESYNIFTGYTPNAAFYELVSEEAAAEENEVLLNQPNDNQVFTAVYTIKFNYTVTFYQGTAKNSSLWSNSSGTWARKQWNTTNIVNATMHTISYTFSGVGVYLWNIQAFNTTTAHWAASNRTLIIQASPPADDPPTYIDHTVSTAEVGVIATFACQWIDDVQLYVGWMAHNNSGSWVNRSTVGLYAPYNTFVDSFTLNSVIGTVVGFRFYANDTAGQVTASEIFTLTTIAEYFAGKVSWTDWWG